MIIMTNFLLLIGAGLFSKAIWDFQEHAFNTMCASVPSMLLRLR
jgi:high-affinity iron transporter